MKRILVVGSLNMDIVIETPCMPKAGETIAGKSIAQIPGGKGANQAFAAGKLGGNILEDKADVAAAEDGKLFVVHFRQFFVPDNHIAGSRGVQPAHHVKQGGLAAAGGSHNGHKFAVIYREVHAIKGAGDIRLCTVILFQVDSL